MSVLPILALPAPFGLLPLLPVAEFQPVQLAPAPVVCLEDIEAFAPLISAWISGAEVHPIENMVDKSEAQLSDAARWVVLASTSESRLL